MNALLFIALLYGWAKLQQYADNKFTNQPNH